MIESKGIKEIEDRGERERESGTERIASTAARNGGHTATGLVWGVDCLVVLGFFFRVGEGGLYDARTQPGSHSIFCA